MGVLRNLDRDEKTVPGTSVASVALRYGDCLRDTSSASRLSSRRLGVMATERTGDLGRKPESWSLEAITVKEC